MATLFNRHTHFLLLPARYHPRLQVRCACTRNSIRTTRGKWWCKHATKCLFFQKIMQISTESTWDSCQKLS
ncbi:hypothetical protein T4E_7266 [Trichinella pseudospiralis]|uniref:Uncharacterized protein n=1 Tax=Trichinella pseudospiralis TaxID=6337 RepID=A0A0V0XTM7_TRIPS|nr:hypothetical protein T4E_7266 [Trichinella pseudospiralis]